MTKIRACEFFTIARIVFAVAIASVVAIAHAQTIVPVQRPVLPQSRLSPEIKSGLSAALGQESFLYQVRSTHDGLGAVNPRQRLVLQFNSDSVEVRSGASHWRLAVYGCGYGENIQRVTAALPEASRNRIAYRRGRLTEWYVNGPLGLEQGFTISEPRRGEKTGPLTIAMTLSGDLRATINREASGLSLTDNSGKPVLRYAGLSAHDASGRSLRSWLELTNGGLLLRTDETGAHYPVLIDPVVQLAELTASDGVNGDQLGISVSISGNTLVAGAENASVNGNSAQGAAYVFVKPASGWANMTETAKLTAADGQANDNFGGAVYISGNTILVGACPQSGMCNGPGKVYVFVKPQDGWKTTSQFKAELTASDGTANDGFSNELGLSTEGTTAVVGAAGATVNGTAGQGAAYVFVRPSTGWKTSTETAKLTESPGAASEFAGEVSVSGDGSTVFVGAPGATVGSNVGQGVAYVFVRPTAGWATTSTFTARLFAANGAASDDFGFCQAGSTCISSDGTTLLVGAPQENFSTLAFTGPGKAYVFVKPANGWSSTSKFNAELTASDGQTGDALGWSVALSNNAAILGAVAGNGGTGAAYVFLKPTTGWKTTSKFAAKLVPSDGDVGDAFAFSVSISGNVGAVGALNHPAGSVSGPGAAYVFGQ